MTFKKIEKKKITNMTLQLYSHTFVSSENNSEKTQKQNYMLENSLLLC